MTTDSDNKPSWRRAALWTCLFALPVAAAFFHFRDDATVAPNPFPVPVRDATKEARFADSVSKFRMASAGIKTDRLNGYDTHLTTERLALRGHATAREEIADYAAKLPAAVEFLSETRPHFARATEQSPVPGGMTEHRAAVQILTAASIQAVIEHRSEDAVVLWEKSGFHRIDSRESSLNLIMGLMTVAGKEIENRTLTDLAFTDSDPARIRRIMTVMGANAPEPGLFRRTLIGEYEFCKVWSPRLADYYRTAGDLTPFLKWKLPDWPAFGLALRSQWYGMNTLPNATVNAYAEVLPKLADPAASASTTPQFSFFAKHLGRNCGGLAATGLSATGDMFTLLSDRFGNRAEASHRLALTAVALRLYELEHGRRPANLADLAPAFLAVAPVDPYDGKSLRYDAAKGWIWSVGKDLTDELGDADSDIVVWLPGTEPADDESPFDTEKRLKAEAAGK